MVAYTIGQFLGVLKGDLLSRSRALNMRGCQNYDPSFWVPPKYEVPYYNRDRKGDHNFDKAPI